ncbi:MAG TPA: GNAT family N-acetyltransferase, partial [Phenylobacterium sp.]|nr:GNAT family N-acetyltransferase [Phenylobacterium sp.]
MTVEILRVASANAAVLERLAEDVFDEAIDAGLLAAYLAQPGHLMVVAVSDGVVIGQARGMVHHQPDEPTHLYVDNLGVTPSRQREGIARRLLEALFDWARELGCTAFWVATETDNAPARALYASYAGEPQEMV